VQRLRPGYMIKPEGERPPAPVAHAERGPTTLSRAESLAPDAEVYDSESLSWREKQIAAWGSGSGADEFYPHASIENHIRIVDVKVVYPGAPHHVIAEMLGLSKGLVSSVLATKYAKRRMDLTADIREPIQRRLRNNVFKSLEYLQRVLAKANVEIEKESPDVNVLRSGDKAASETLRGTGILQDFHNIPNAGDKPVSFTDIRAMLADPALAAALKAKNEQEAHEQAP